MIINARNYEEERDFFLWDISCTTIENFNEEKPLLAKPFFWRTLILVGIYCGLFCYFC
jgi:hypothetical protein